MAKLFIPCKTVLALAAYGMLSSRQIEDLRKKRAIHRHCADDARKIIRGKISLNGRRRTR